MILMIFCKLGEERKGCVLATCLGGCWLMDPDVATLQVVHGGADKVITDKRFTPKGIPLYNGRLNLWRFFGPF